jgi:hypothetical protein
MQQKQPMNQAQQRMLVVSLLLIVLAAVVFLLLTGKDKPSPAAPTASPEATFSTVEEALINLPTPTPTPSPTPSGTPVQLNTPEPPPVPTQTPATLKKGSKGVEVVRMQVRLIELGYLPAGQNDGDYGSATEAAVRDFQRVNSLQEDGIAGQQTQTRLYSDEALRKEP